jgi:hypothetical protein
MPTDPPKKKAARAAKKTMSASAMVDPGATAADKELAGRALPVLQAMQDYTSSADYLARLRGMKVDNPEAIQAERLATLGRVKFGHMTSGNNNTPRNYGWGGANDKAKGGFIAMSKESPLSKVAHEISHNTNRSIALPVSEGARATTATGASLAPVESWKLVNAAKMDPQIKAKAFEQFRDSAKGPYGVMVADPTACVSGYDEHGKDAAELKSDLDGLRYLLYQKGVTKKFGETLDPQKLKRAMNLPDIQKDEIFQRMLKQYDPEAIIYLNNKIAKGKSTASNLA